MKVRVILILGILFWLILEFGLSVALSVFFIVMFVGIFSLWIYLIVKAVRLEFR